MNASQNIGLTTLSCYNGKRFWFLFFQVFLIVQIRYQNENPPLRLNRAFRTSAAKGGAWMTHIVDGKNSVLLTDAVAAKCCSTKNVKMTVEMA